MRPCFRLVVMTLLASPWWVAPARADDLGLWARHCGDCHGDGAAEGGLALDTLLARVPRQGSAAGGPDEPRWMAVLRNLRSETMPPVEAPKLSAEDRRRLIAFVERDVFRIDPARPDPGRVVLRRLNRHEYANTIRDLTGLDLPVAAELPEDDTGYGFDTIGDVLTMSPLLVEKLLAIADEVAEAVVEAAVPARDPTGAARSYHGPVAVLFPCGPPPPDVAARPAHLRDTIVRVATRAFRRPADAPTIDRLVAIAEAAITDPDGSFEQGVAAALTAMLSSPRFLFRVEAAEPAAASSAAPPSAVPLDGHSLAARLSYLLWSSTPDDRLLTLADQGRLGDGLRAEVDRLIDDAKFERFSADFVGQWLRTRDVEGMTFDLRRVLQGRVRFGAERVFSDRVRRAMRQETEMLVTQFIRDNRPARDLLVARETFLNGPLARFYGVPDVEGPEMRLVALGDDTHRGGLLTHGSILMVTSNPGRTSPVKRGQFILDNLLGTPAPPPPPNVPPLEAADRGTGELTMRQLMERHRQDPLCASCHARMDPLGLAFEGYNAIGQWRGDAAAAIDTSGRLITGEAFADARELADLIAGPRRRDYHRCLTEKLLVYALGRGLEFGDGPAVDTIVERMEQDGGGLRTLLHAICESVPFRMRRPSSPEEVTKP